MKKCIKSHHSLSESGIKQESMFLLVLLCKLAGLFAAHKLCISSQFFSQWAVSTSLCAPGSFFDASLYGASFWADREFTLPQSVSSLSTHRKHSWLCSSNSSLLLLTQLWLPQLYILQSNQSGFTFFLHKRLPFYLPAPPVQKPRNFTLWVLCFVSSSLERTEEKADGKRWKSKKKE